jgi:ion channel POLLUX/CASTOR
MHDSPRCSNAEADDEPIAGQSWLPIIVIILGAAVIFKFLASEFKIARSKVKSGRENFSLSEILHYRADYYFSKHDSAKSLLLMGITFILMVSTTMVLYIVTGEDVSVCMWRAWTYIADAGTHAETEGSARRTVALFTTIAGMLVFAMFIGLVSDSIQEGLDSLRKGRCRVVETGHTVILGWNSQSLCILQQLALANRSEGGGLIAVLCEQNKAEMERLLDDAQSGDFSLHGTSVAFRTGDPLSEGSLSLVAAASARSIVAVTREGTDPDEADALAVQLLLALRSGLGHPYAGHVVVEMNKVLNKLVLAVLFLSSPSLISVSLSVSLALALSLSRSLVLSLSRSLSLSL